MSRPVVFSLFREQSIFMTVIVSMLTFLSVLALGISLSIGTGVIKWNRQWDLFATIQITDKQNTENVKKILDNNKNKIKNTTELSKNDMTKLIAPWISGGNSVLQNYIPQMYEIELKTKSDVAVLEKQITPYARFLTHKNALEPSISAGWKMIFISGFILSLILLTIGVCISFIARNTAVLHKRELEILNQIGASDSFIANQMQIIVLKICSIACFSGFLVALPILLLILSAATSARVGLLAMLGLSEIGWGILCILPFAIIIFAIIVTRKTTLKILKNS